MENSKQVIYELNNGLRIKYDNNNNSYNDD